MLFGIGSGKLHTGRRVQLVIWLQIMQEWIGIAGVTIFAPTIFRTAGIPNTQVQWISGLNTITYMVSFVAIPMAKSSLINLDGHSYLCLHSRQDRSSLDSLLGLSRPGYFHVPRWWSRHPWSSAPRRLCSCSRRQFRRCCHDFPIHSHIWRYLAHCSMAVPC